MVQHPRVPRRGQQPRCPPFLFALALALAASCAAEPHAASVGAARRDAPVHPRGQTEIRVGNRVRGLESQPDYDEAAQALRQHVEGHLPHPLPVASAACATMMQAAIAAYRAAEGPEARAVRLLEAARSREEQACVRETSPAAAACAAYLIERKGEEFAWVLDQCSRAFPA